MRFLAPPTPSKLPPGGPDSIGKGKSLFTKIACAHCHTPIFDTGKTASAALSGKAVNLYSDLALHAMGPGLADDVAQGAADGDEFRTAPAVGARPADLLPPRRTDLEPDH